MIEKNNSYCSICGKGYYICLACKSHRLAPWKIHTDTSEHYKVYQILHGYSTGIYDKNEAKSKLQKVDLSDINDFRFDIKLLIQNILSDDEKNIEDEKVTKTISKSKIKTTRRRKSTE